jgi:hypothetical protein
MRLDRPPGPRPHVAACAALAATLVACFASDTPAPGSVEDEVLDNVRRQRAGSHEVGDLGLPEPFLRRVADRVIRSTWQERYQRVADHRWQPPPQPAAWVTPLEVPSRLVDLVEPRPMPPAVEAYRASVPQGRPELRGYRIPLLDRAADAWPFASPGAEAAAEVRAAAAIVAQELDQGLLRTVIRVIDTLGLDAMATQDDAGYERLRSVGLPVDWLAHFEAAGPGVPGPPDADEAGRARASLRELIRARKVEPDAVPELLASRFAFRFRPTRDGFRAASESGEHEPGTMRLQLTRGDHWGGPGDGGSVDLARQLVERLPETEFLISIERKFVSALQRTAESWTAQPGGRARLLIEDRPVSQWAQDNGKAGLLRAEGTERPATLVPRYASRREDGSELVPSESFLAETLAVTGHAVVQSPLSFQGGDLLIATHPERNERILFLGEAELWRNTSLGLDREQVLAAFREELDVDRCEVLPSLSFHLDFDVSFRASGNKLVAFVNDREQAAEILARRGLDRLVASGVLAADEATAARGLLDRREDRAFVTLVAGRLVPTMVDGRAYPVAVASPFGGEPSRAVADFHRFLLALDLLAEPTLSPGELAEPGHRGAYFRALRREREAAAELARRLASAGLVVVAVPGISEGARSIGYLNGIHTPGRYWMPAYGGSYEELDRAALAAFSRALGDAVQIIPIRAAETQQRMGGLHCAVATYPPASGSSR